jgi:hypothetical protein
MIRTGQSEKMCRNQLKVFTRLVMRGFASNQLMRHRKQVEAFADVRQDFIAFDSRHLRILVRIQRDRSIVRMFGCNQRASWPPSLSLGR